MPSLLSGAIDLKFVPQDGVPLTRQIYDRLRAAILSGALPQGYRLPSSRALADDCAVSRNTVSSVIDQLAGFHHQNAVGEQQRFVDVVGHEEHCRTVLAPQVQEHLMQLELGHVIQ